MAEKRDQVFVCYAHADENYLQRLKVHLRPYERQSNIIVWSDTKIKAGQQWREEIEKGLQRAAVVILLVSADFLASDFITDNELPRILLAAQTEGVKILPIILKPCALTIIEELSQFQAVNDPATPLISMNESDQEKTWANLAKATRESLDEFNAQAIAKEKVENSSPNMKSSIDWGKGATLFWLGNDLMWIKYMAYRMESPERLIQGIIHAMKYAKDLGFPLDTSPYIELNTAKETLESLLGIVPTTNENRALLESHYRSVIKYVETVKWIISALAEAEEPGFVKLRVF